MGYRAAEEVTLPARFLATTAHFVAVLTTLFDVRTLASQVLLAQSSDTSSSDLYSAGDLDALAQRMSGAAYAAMACFAVEYVGLFLGVSLFMRAHNCLYILLHSIGAVLIGLLYTQAWSSGVLIGFVVAFNSVPACLELLTFLFVARVSFFRY